MKTTKIALITFAIVLPILVNAEEKKASPLQGKGIVGWSKLSPLERHKQGVDGDIKSRKIDLKPVKQADGIKTGLVIAYGHVIPPPYKVYTENKKVMINGVQVIPSMVWEREAPKYVPTTRTTDEQKLAKRSTEVLAEARRIYCSGKDTKSMSLLSDDISNHISNAKDVVISAKWYSGKKLPQDSIQITWVKNVGPDAVSFRASECTDILRTSSELRGQADVRHQDALAEGQKSIERRLEKGWTLIFASHGQGQSYGDVRDEIVAVMENADLSPDQKAEEIKKRKLGFGYSGALDVVENYSSGEWKAR